MTVKKTRRIPIAPQNQAESNGPRPEKTIDIPTSLKEFLDKIDYEIAKLQGKKSDLVSGFLLANDVDINKPFSTDQAYTQVSVFTAEEIKKYQQAPQ